MSEEFRIRGLMAAVKANAQEKGWYDTPTTLGQELALLHCEVSETTEEARRHDPTHIYEEIDPDVAMGAGRKPKGVPIELADVILKACEIAARYDVDLESAIERKLAWNRTRRYRHGNKRF
jgi:NTP pyrophosphatase (non-canonical NTP hydrolase)